MSAPSDESLQRLAQRVGRILTPRAQTVTTAESCTGGWIAKALTDVPGSSAWFESGYVTYSNSAKVRELGVPARPLAVHGAVSAAVVERMARGALRRAGASLAIAVSGIAGPQGGSPEKPVGTVWFAVARRVGRRIEVTTFCRRFRGDRDGVRRRTVALALRTLAAV